MHKITTQKNWRGDVKFVCLTSVTNVFPEKINISVVRIFLWIQVSLS